MKLDQKYNFYYSFKDGQFQHCNDVVEFVNDHVLGCHKLTTANGSIVFIAHNTWQTYEMQPTEPIKQEMLDPSKLDSWVSGENPPSPNGLYVALVKDDKSSQGLTIQMASFGGNSWCTFIQEDDGYWQHIEVDVVAYIPINFGLNAIKDVREYFGNGDK